MFLILPGNRQCNTDIIINGTPHDIFCVLSPEPDAFNGSHNVFIAIFSYAAALNFNIVYWSILGTLVKKQCGGTVVSTLLAHIGFELFGDG